MKHVVSHDLDEEKAKAVARAAFDSYKARFAEYNPTVTWPTDKHEVIFEPFVQLDRSLTQTREGLGLGLAISRDLARGMAGDLAVETHAGSGARFVLLLPRGRLTDDDVRAHTGEIPAVPAR